MTELQRLHDGARVLVLGGGPGGSVCALALLRRARAAGKRIEVVILEPRQTTQQRKQCAGVLSPPLQQVLRDELAVELPAALLQRRIREYAIHGDACCLRLPLEQNGEQTFATPRGELDTFLLDSAEHAGARVIRRGAQDVVFGPRGVTVYFQDGSLTGEVLVGAFGLEPTVGDILRQRIGYAPPPHLRALVTNLHPGAGDDMPVLRQDTVHAFLPRLRGFEFGALIPRLDRVSVVVAGQHLDKSALDAFLAVPSVCELLGRRRVAAEQGAATFPNGLAQHAYADRFVCVGDAAGLVRPFKGKGIYSAAITGIRAAKTMLEVGISRQAFATYHADCSDLVRDVQYGRLVRLAALVLAKRLSFDPVIESAREDASLRKAVFMAVSGHGSSRDIFWLAARPRSVRAVLQRAWSSRQRVVAVEMSLGNAQ